MKTSILLVCGSILAAFIPSTTARSETVQEFNARFENTNPALLYLREFLVNSSISKEPVKEAVDQFVVDEDSRRLATDYDSTFQRIRKYGVLKGVCDWGDDWSEGPNLPLPHLAKVRELVLIGIVRARVFLEAGDSLSAARDLVAVAQMSSHLAASPIMVNLIFDYRMDRMIADFLSRNLYRFDEAGLRELKNGLASLPVERSIADSVDTDRRFIGAGWVKSKLLEVKLDAPATEEARLAAMRPILDSIALNPDFLLQESDGSIDQLLRWVEAALPVYAEFKELCYEKDYWTVKPKFEALERRVEESNNPFRGMFFYGISRNRFIEMGNEALQAMVRAALEIQLNGADALASIEDPFGDGAFGFETVKAGDVAVGYMLVSDLPIEDDNRRVFLTREADGIQVSGAGVGMF